MLYHNDMNHFLVISSINFVLYHLHEKNQDNIVEWKVYQFDYVLVVEDIVHVLIVIE